MKLSGSIICLFIFWCRIAKVTCIPMICNFYYVIIWCINKALVPFNNVHSISLISSFSEYLCIFIAILGLSGSFRSLIIQFVSGLKWLLWSVINSCGTFSCLWFSCRAIWRMTYLWSINSTKFIDNSSILNFLSLLRLWWFLTMVRLFVSFFKLFILIFDHIN